MRSIKLPYNIPPIENIIDQLPKHPTKMWGLRDFDEVKRLIVHHFASEAPLENQARYHINAHNWPGIAYNLAVSGGRLKQTNDLLAYTTHARGANDDSIAIAVHGDLSKREMTSQERELLYAGILLVKHIWPNIEVQGHNEVSATACPCTSMHQIREDIAALELKMSVTDTPNDQLARAFKVAGRVQDLYGIASKPGQYQTEALRKLAIVEDAMNKAGIL